MVSDQDAIRIYQALLAHHIPVWIVGGWGIDALLQERTRPHKDLDVLMLVDDVVRLRELLGRAGYGLKELWTENAWVLDSGETEVPTAFVLQDTEGREVDVHAMRLDDRGNGLPAWAAGDLAPEDHVLRSDYLAGEGVIAGVNVQCFSAEMQVLAHTGYDLPAEHAADLRLLRDRFGLDCCGASGSG